FGPISTRRTDNSRTLPSSPRWSRRSLWSGLSRPCSGTVPVPIPATSAAMTGRTTESQPFRGLVLYPRAHQVPPVGDDVPVLFRFDEVIKPVRIEIDAQQPRQQLRLARPEFVSVDEGRVHRRAGEHGTKIGQRFRAQFMLGAQIAAGLAIAAQ